MTPDRFEDFADVINPNRRADSLLVPVAPAAAPGDPRARGDGSREQAMRALCEREHPPGVVTYLDGTPVGWCNIGPRVEIPRLAQLEAHPAGRRPAGVEHHLRRRARRPPQEGRDGHLLEGAVAYAAANGAPAVEAHPVDPQGRMDTTMAFVGTRSMFEKAGFEVVGTTDAVASRMPRLVMRRILT